jgi:hypothetical protein
MKVQTMADLMAEMRAVARGEIPAPPDAAEPSIEPAEALRRERKAALDELARLGQEVGIGYDGGVGPSKQE